MSAADNLYAELTRGVAHAQVRQHLIDEHRAEVLGEAAAAVDSGKAPFPDDVKSGASWAARMLRRMAEEEGKDTGTGTIGGEPTPAPDFFQPGRTYTDNNGYRAPEITTNFHVEHVTRHPASGRLRAIGWSRSLAPGSRWHGDFRDEDEFEGWTELSAPLLGGDPLVVRRFDSSIEPALEDDNPELLVCCVAEDGRPVALLLDDEARAKLADLLGLAEGKGTGSGEPTPRRTTAERRHWLLSVIISERGQWTVGRVKRLYGRHHEGAVLRTTIRKDLGALHAAGELQMHDGSDRRYYTLTPGGGR
ncbi:hypothetical protein [Streptomyces vinaceus]|uniref:hypothetical protein n=1 Tax=Streptomyces vinaceus TaxID=1960 RepID=UPI0036C624B1